MTETAPKMRPEDVPAEWVALAKEADLAHIHRRLKTAGPGAGGVRPTSDHQTARLIAAVLPAHEAMVRAKVAEEIWADWAKGNAIAPYARCIAVARREDPDMAWHMQTPAEAARGDQP